MKTLMSEFLFSIEHILFWVWHKSYLLIMWRAAGGVLRYLRMFLFKEKLPISGYLADTCTQLQDAGTGEWGRFLAEKLLPNHRRN